MVLSGILTRATYGRERIYGHADVTAANGLERGPLSTTPKPRVWVNVFGWVFNRSYCILTLFCVIVGVL